MADSLYRVPVDFPNFGRTVTDPVDLADYDPPVDVTRELDDLAGVRVWGTRKGDGNRDRYGQMASGDWTLFYHDGTYVATGRVGVKFESPWVSRTFWGYAPKQLLYTVERYRDLDAALADVNADLGLDPDDEPPRIERVPDDAVAALRDEHGSVRAFLDSLAGE
jgi:putative restriction endonuclease